MAAANTPEPGTLIVLPDTGKFSIGRSDVSASILVGRPYSYHHAQFLREQRGWVVQESSGLSVNRRPVQRIALKSGDELAGGRMEFRFLEGDIEGLADDLRKRFALDSTARLTIPGLDM